MQFNRLPRCSSSQLTRALERLGCYPARSNRGSHQTYHRDMGGRVLSAPVTLGKREIPRGTLRNILTLLDIPLEEFLDALR